MLNWIKYYRKLSISEQLMIFNSLIYEQYSSISVSLTKINGSARVNQWARESYKMIINGVERGDIFKKLFSRSFVNILSSCGEYFFVSLLICRDRANKMLVNRVNKLIGISYAISIYIVLFSVAYGLDSNFFYVYYQDYKILCKPFPYVSLFAYKIVQVVSSKYSSIVFIVFTILVILFSGTFNRKDEEFFEVMIFTLCHDVVSQDAIRISSLLVFNTHINLPKHYRLKDLFESIHEVKKYSDLIDFSSKDKFICSIKSISQRIADIRKIKQSIIGATLKVLIIVILITYLLIIFLGVIKLVV